MSYSLQVKVKLFLRSTALICLDGSGENGLKTMPRSDIVLWYGTVL